MKYKLYCILFGHDFRIKKDLIDEDGDLATNSIPSMYCRQCGLSKSEIFKSKG